MSLTTAALRELVTLGLTAEQILAVAEANEAPARDRSANAERQARFRARKAEAVTPPVTSNVTDNADVTSRPLPPPPQTPPPPTPTLGEQSRSRKGRLEKPEKRPDITERVWLSASKTSRDRSGRPVLAKAVLAAIRSGATDDSLIASVRDHCQAQGEFAKGVHLIVGGEHWRDHLAANDAPTKPVDPAVTARRLQRYRDTGVWEPGWGSPPADDVTSPNHPLQGQAA